MRMCGHAHHDDMLYLGKEPPISWDYPPLTRAAATPTASSTTSGRAAIRSRPTPRGSRPRASSRRAISSGSSRRPQTLVEARGAKRHRRAVAGAARAPAPASSRASRRAARRSRSIPPRAARRRDTALPPLETGPPVRPEGHDVPRGGRARRRRRAARRSARLRLRRGRRRQVRQRVPAAAAAARGIRRPHLNSPLAEGAVLGVCVGAALAGQRPIGEMQFNDFVATGFNQLVNNAAKIRYRWGGVRSRWSCACRGAACATPVRTTARTPRRGSTGRRD